MTTREYKSGDTGFQVTSTLKKDGSVVDITGASVLMLLELVESPNTRYSITASVVSGPAGTVKALGTTSGWPTVPGRYRQEWQVTFTDNTILTFPSGEYNTIKVLNDLN